MHHCKHWLTSAGSGSRCHYLKEGKFGTFMLMSPMLMFLGISGRFMFFTADTARAGAPAIPAYTHTHTHAQKTHTRRVDKTQTSEAENMPLQDETLKSEHSTHTVLNKVLDNQLLTKCKSTDSY